MLKETKELITKVEGNLVNIEEDIWIRATHITVEKEEAISHADGSVSPYRETVSIGEDVHGSFGITGREKIKRG